MTREFLIDNPRQSKPGRPVVAIDPEDASRRREIEHEKLRRMIAYADPAARDRCRSCSNCQLRPPAHARTLPARHAGYARGDWRRPPF